MEERSTFGTNTSKSTSNRFKILNLFNLKGGCEYVRHEVPFTTLQKRGHYVKMNFPVHRMDFQIAILSRAISKQLFEILMKMKAIGMQIIYDTDDLLFELEPDNPFYSDQASIKAVQMTRQIISMMDMVTVTTEALKREISAYYDGPVKVLPNCVKPEDWKERSRTSKKLRIGYTGSASHYREFNFLVPIIKRLQKRHDFEFHLFGLFDKPADIQAGIDLKVEKNTVWKDHMRETQNLIKDFDFVHHPFVSKIEDYRAKLSELDLDIGLAPLFDTKFNRCKSNLKYLEYAMVGTAPIVSDIETYFGCSNEVPMDDLAWEARIEHMIFDKQFRETIAFNAKALVLDKFSIEKKIELWEEAYSECLNPSRIHLAKTFQVRNGTLKHVS